MTTKKTRSAVADPLLKEKDVSELLGVSDRTVRNLVARGVLPACRIRTGADGRPGPIRFRQSDVDALLTVIPTADAPDVDPALAQALANIEDAS